MSNEGTQHLTRWGDEVLLGFDAQRAIAMLQAELAEARRRLAAVQLLEGYRYECARSHRVVLHDGPYSEPERLLQQRLLGLSIGGINRTESRLTELAERYAAMIAEYEEATGRQSK